MSNENEVYIIEDIHPMDATYHRKDEIIGTPITNVQIDNMEWIAGWKGTSRGYSEVCGGVFFAVKLSPTPPKKSFWQKLEDIYWELFG